MDIKLEEKDGLNAVLAVHVSPEDYEQGISDSIKDYRRQLKLPGFRPGKVPPQVVKRLMLEQLKKEQIEKKVQEGLVEYMKEESLDLIMNPILREEDEEIDWKTKADFTFRYDIGLRPEVKLQPEELKELIYHKVNLSKEDIDQEIQQLRQQHGEVKKLEEVEDDEDMNLYLRFRELLNEEGEELEDGVRKVKSFKWSNLPEKFRELLLGKKPEDKVQVNIKEAFTPEELQEALEVDENVAQDLEQFEVEILQLFKWDLAEMNEEFFKKALPDQEISSEEELREQIESFVQDYYNSQSHSLLLEQIRDRIVDSIEMDLPRDFLRKWMERQQEQQEGEQADLNDQMDELEKSLRWSLLAEQVMQENDIKVEMPEMEATAKSLIWRELSTKGMAGQLDEQQLNQIAHNYLHEERNRVQIHSMIRDNKVLENLKEQVNFDTKEVSTEEFNSLRNQQS